MTLDLWAPGRPPVEEVDRQGTLLLIEDCPAQRGWVQLALERRLELRETRIWAPPSQARLQVKLNLLRRAQQKVRVLVTDLRLDQWKRGMDVLSICDQLRPVVDARTVVILASVAEADEVTKEARRLATGLGVAVHPVSKLTKGYVDLVAKRVQTLAQVS